MTDPEDKTGRHGNWANKIPLMTLLAIVFTAGGVFVKQQFIESKIDKAVERFERYATTSEARVRQLEEYRIAHEAMTSPLMQKFLEEHATKKVVRAKAAPVPKEPGP